MQVNKINLNSFTGSLILPVDNGLPIKLNKNSIISISSVEGNEKTIIEEKCSGWCSKMTLVPIPIDKVMAAYTTSVLAPDDVEINLTNLYV